MEDARIDPRIAYTVPADWHDLGPLVVVPLRTLDGVEGVLTFGWTPEQISAFRAVDVRMPERFAGQAALALQISRAARTARSSPCSRTATGSGATCTTS